MPCLNEPVDHQPSRWIPCFYALMPGESIPPSLLHASTLMSRMFHFGVDRIQLTKEPQHILPSLAPPKGEMARSFGWTSVFKSPRPRPLCLDDPTLARLNQVTSVSMCETEFCTTRSIHFCDAGVHTGATFLLIPRKNLTRLPPRSSFPNPFWINFLLMTRSPSLNTTRRSHLQPSHPIPRPYLTIPRMFLCIFKKNLLHLQVTNHQDILKKPQTLMNSAILPWSTSLYPIELRMLLTLTNSYPSTVR